MIVGQKLASDIFLGEQLIDGRASEVALADRRRIAARTVGVDEVENDVAARLGSLVVGVALLTSLKVLYQEL